MRAWIFTLVSKSWQNMEVHDTANGRHVRPEKKKKTLENVSAQSDGIDIERTSTASTQSYPRNLVSGIRTESTDERH